MGLRGKESSGGDCHGAAVPSVRIRSSAVKKIIGSVNARSCSNFFVESGPGASKLILVEGVVVIVAYRPKAGHESELLELVRGRVPSLRKEGLVTDRVPVMMRAKDGTIIEVSEWKSQQAIEEAHKNPRVLAMWDKFFAVCDCVPLKTVLEAETMFAGFEPIPTPPAEGMPTTEPLR
jgi:quinol monooxygenase YgiN